MLPHADSYLLFTAVVEGVDDQSGVPRTPEPTATLHLPDKARRPQTSRGLERSPAPCAIVMHNRFPDTRCDSPLSRGKSVIELESFGGLVEAMAVSSHEKKAKTLRQAYFNTVTPTIIIFR